MQSLAPFAPAGAVGAAYDINEAGQIVGTYTSGAFVGPEWPSPGFLLTAGVFTPMGHLGSEVESRAMSINDHGVAVGHAHEIHTNFYPFMYSAAGLQHLGVLSPYHTEAYDINNLGQSVGSRSFGFGTTGHAMLYEGGGADAWLDLNMMVDPASGWTLTSANAINDLRQIAATGCRDGACYAVRLDLIPAVPEPSSAAVLLAGLGMIGWRSRRRGEAFQPQTMTPA